MPPVDLRVTGPAVDGYYPAVLTYYDPDAEDWYDDEEVRVLDANGEALGNGTVYKGHVHGVLGDDTGATNAGFAMLSVSAAPAGGVPLATQTVQGKWDANGNAQHVNVNLTNDGWLTINDAGAAGTHAFITVKDNSGNVAVRQQQNTDGGIIGNAFSIYPATFNTNTGISGGSTCVVASGLAVGGSIAASDYIVAGKGDAGTGSNGSTAGAYPVRITGTGSPGWLTQLFLGSNVNLTSRIALTSRTERNLTATILLATLEDSSDSVGANSVPYIILDNVAPGASHGTARVLASGYSVFEDTGGGSYTIRNGVGNGSGGLLGPGARAVWGLIVDVGSGTFVGTATANTFTVGPQTIQTDATGHSALILQGFSGQTADLQQNKDSTGAVKSYMDKDGRSFVKAATDFWVGTGNKSNF
jgi:hypothetical protein